MATWWGNNYDNDHHGPEQNQYGLGGDDTKVDDHGADDTLANPKPTFPSSSPYGSPPVPTQPTSPEDWPRA